MDGASRTLNDVLDRTDSECGIRGLAWKEGAAVCTVSDSRIYNRGMDMDTYMKRRGRFVLEAVVLVPGICLLLVQLCFFTLYAHDYTVCVHTSLEAGVKGIYPSGFSNRKTEENIEADLRQKLKERLLWLRNPEIEIQVNPVQAEIIVTGTGSFWPAERIEARQKIYRIQASEAVRRSRWLKELEDRDGSALQKRPEQ